MAGSPLLINERYLTVEKLARDCFGTVWKSYDLEKRQTLLVKEFSRETADEEYIREFHRENLLERKSQEGLVAVRRLLRGENDFCCALLEYVEGITLEQVIDKSRRQHAPVPWQLALYIAGQILKTLNALNKGSHQHASVVHQKISPDNLFLSFSGALKLGPTGTTRSREIWLAAAPAALVSAHYAYMSPEQIRGSTVDQRSDVFSAGVVLCELLIGGRLYDGTSSKVREHILSARFDPALLINRAYPDEIVDLVAQALQKDPERRYQKSIDMFGDIRRILKWKEEEKLSQELAAFLLKNYGDELAAENEFLKHVTALTKESASAASVERIACADFVPSAQPPRKAVRSAHAEGKGKTVFETAGEWLRLEQQFLLRLGAKAALSALVALLLFAVVDFLFRLTPAGRALNALAFPPDVVVTTVPPGASVTVTTRSGEPVLLNADSIIPVELRRIPPKIYVITATLGGFRPPRVLVRVSERTRVSRYATQRVNVLFDFPFTVNSDPPGAQLTLDGTPQGVTPCRLRIPAGFHSLGLSLPGYRELGSAAKPSADGRCRVNLTQLDPAEMFRDVDAQYWTVLSTTVAGLREFVVTGRLARDVTLHTAPEGMLLQGEGIPGCTTPATVPLKCGTYTFTVSDPGNNYYTATVGLTISPESAGEYIIRMHRLVRPSGKKGAARE